MENSFLIFPLLLVGPAIIVLVLALVLPKTGPDKIFALSLALVFIVIDWKTMMWWNMEWWKTARIVRLHLLYFWPLAVFALAIPFRRYLQDKPLLVLLIATGLVILALAGRWMWAEMTSKRKPARAEQYERYKMDTAVAESHARAKQNEYGERFAEYRKRWNTLVEENYKKSGEFIYHTAENVDSILIKSGVEATYLLDDYPHVYAVSPVEGKLYWFLKYEAGSPDIKLAVSKAPNLITQQSVILYS
jgi:hypothetical protein